MTTNPAIIRSTKEYRLHLMEFAWLRGLPIDHLENPGPNEVSNADLLVEAKNLARHDAHSMLRSCDIDWAKNELRIFNRHQNFPEIQRFTGLISNYDSWFDKAKAARGSKNLKFQLKPKAVQLDIDFDTI